MTRGVPWRIEPLTSFVTSWTWKWWMFLLPVPEYQQAVFMRRLNRFAAEVRLPQGTAVAHVPDPGRLKELLFPGNQVLVIPSGNPERRTSCSLLAARRRNCWIPANTTFHSGIAASMIESGLFSRRPVSIRREATLPGLTSRFDFLIDEDTLVEVKGCTLSTGCTALFPDAPTVRGARQVREIAGHVGQGGRGMVIFLVMVPWARRIAANPATDPEFTETLMSAEAAGVTVNAAVIVLMPGGFHFMSKIPFIGGFDYRNTIVEPEGIHVPMQKHQPETGHSRRSSPDP